MSESIEKQFETVLEKLKKEERGKTQISLKLFDEITLTLQDKNSPLLLKALCCLQHSFSTDPRIPPLLTQLLESDLASKTQQEVISSSVSQIIEYYQKLGKRLPGEYLVALKKHLSSKDADLLYWSVWAISHMGSQKIFFKESLQKVKPGKMKQAYSKKHRDIAQLMELCF